MFISTWRGKARLNDTVGISQIDYTCDNGQEFVQRLQ